MGSVRRDPPGQQANCSSRDRCRRNPFQAARSVWGEFPQADTHAPNGGSLFKRQTGEDGASGYSMLLASYAPGKGPDVYPAGTAKRIPAGSTVVLQIRYFVRTPVSSMRLGSKSKGLGPQERSGEPSKTPTCDPLVKRGLQADDNQSRLL